MYYGQCPFLTNNYMNQYRGGAYTRNDQSPEAMIPEAVVNPSNMNPNTNPVIAQLESMYPKVYRIILPRVVYHCDNLDKKHDNMYVPTREEMNHMVDDIYSVVEADVSMAAQEESREIDVRQLGLSGRGLLRGLIGTILLNELIGRRRRPYYGYPSPYGYPYGWY